LKLQFNFDKQLFIWLFISFIIATVVGTLTHECGHYAIARYYGYETSISYGHTRLKDTKNQPFLDSTRSKYWAEISAGRDFPQKVKFDRIIETQRNNNFWITLGGPLQTMLTGSIGLVLLFFIRKTFNNRTELSIRQWFYIFISLFWLRQIANFATWIGGNFFKLGTLPRGDEFRLARMLQLPEWTLISLTALIGAIILTVIIFKFIPIKQRITFIISGLLGGITGYILWLILFGKYLMP